MEYFMVFLLVVLIIIVLSNVMAINRLAKKSEQDLERFRNEVSGYLRLIIRSQASLTDKLEGKPKTTVTEPVREPAPTLIVEKSPQPVIEEPRVVAEVKKVIEPIERKETSQFQPTTEPEFISDFRQHKPAKDNRPFFAKYDGLEDFIGGNLINKIAIGILVLGIAFSLKYAIDKEYINEVGRTIIGVFCGVLLLGIAHRLRKLYAAFSSVLIGGAIATWYFTVAFAFQEYKLFPVEVAFVIMVVVTAIAVTLALVYNRIELALIALLGGFATPLMLNTGQGNYQILFSYIAILNIGMMVLVYFKRWNLVNIVAYISTALLYAGWFFTEYEKYSMALRNDDVTAHFPFMGALLFVSIFYLIFFLMNIIINLKKGETISVSEIIILISNSFLFFVAGIFLLDKSYDAYKGLFTIVLTLFNAAFAFGLYFRPTIDRNLKFLLIGLSAAFLTLIAPSQFDGNHITMFWAVEAVLILWFAQVSKIEIIKTGSFVVLIFMFLSMVNDWSVLYVNAPADAPVMPVLFNKGFVTGVLVVGAIFTTLFLLRNEKESLIYKQLPPEILRNALTPIAILFLYLMLFFELDYQLYQHIENRAVRDISLGILNFTYLIVVINRLLRSDYRWLLIGILGIAFIALLSYPAFYQLRFVAIRDSFLQGNVGWTPYLIHYLTLAAIIATLLVFYRAIRTVFQLALVHQILRWFTVVIALFAISVELDHWVLTNFMTPMLPNTSDLAVLQAFTEQKDVLLSRSHRIGFPVLWGLASFILMMVGMRLKLTEWRIISLSVFFLTLVKLFAFDVWRMSAVGKIVSFISLGILLLVVSFMYQKLKRIVLGNEEEAKEV